MRLSCNFVHVYTIAYRVQYTITRVHARIPNGQPCEDPCAEVGEDVRVVSLSVSVSVPWNLSFSLHKALKLEIGSSKNAVKPAELWMVYLHFCFQYDGISSPELFIFCRF